MSVQQFTDPLAGPFVNVAGRTGKWFERLQQSATVMRFRSEHRTTSIFSDEQITENLQSGDLIVASVKRPRQNIPFVVSLTSSAILKTRLAQKIIT